LNVKPSQSHRTTRTSAVVACLFLLAYPLHSLTAQTTPARSIAAVELPDAPGFQSFSTSADPAPNGTASLSGIVVDPTGAAVAGARITLASDGSRSRTAIADNTGAFIFRDLPAGSFNLTILSSADMGSFVSPEIQLLAGEQRQLPNILLSVVAGANVEVTASQSQVAAAQLQEELHQRTLGVFPNFYSSYIWNAAPLSSKQKFVLALRSTTDPANFLALGVLAGVEQAKNIYPGYGQGAEGFAKRYGADYADDFDARIIGSAVLPSLLHQDPRYFYKGSGTVRERLLYALKSAVITRDDNGQLAPNYSYVLGSFASGAISNAYYPAASRGAGLTIANGFLNIAGHAAEDVVREFVLRGLTPGVPATSDGQR
jgi:hypothetical protein